VAEGCSDSFVIVFFVVFVKRTAESGVVRSLIYGRGPYSLLSDGQRPPQALLRLAVASSLSQGVSEISHPESNVVVLRPLRSLHRSEERRVGKEGRVRGCEGLKSNSEDEE